VEYGVPGLFGGVPNAEWVVRAVPLKGFLPSKGKQVFRHLGKAARP
jgi:hypothetical protein